MNSPANWYFAFRSLPHKKDEALAIDISYADRFPIPQPTDEGRAEAERAVGRLVEITRAEQEARRDALDWLRVEYGIQKPGQKLSDFAALDGDEFAEEVRKRRPKGSGRLSPGPQRAAGRVRGSRAAHTRRPHRSRETGETPLPPRQPSLRSHVRGSGPAVVHRPTPGGTRPRRYPKFAVPVARSLVVL